MEKITNAVYLDFSVLSTGREILEFPGYSMVAAEGGWPKKGK